MDLYLRVRQACAEGMSQREAARVFNISRDTVAKMMTFSVPPGYRRTAEVRRPKLDPFIPIIEGWLEADRSMPRKQRHTAKRVFCAFRGIWAVISRDLGHAFHGISGSHFAPSGRLANGCY